MKASLFKTEKGLKILCVGNNKYPSKTLTSPKNFVFSSQLKSEISFVQDFEVADDEEDSFIMAIRPDIVLYEKKDGKKYQLKNEGGYLVVCFYEMSFTSVQKYFDLFNFINQFKAIKSSLNL